MQHKEKEKRSINKILQIGIDNLLFDELMFPSSNMIPIIWPYTTFFDIFDILDCYIRWCYLVGVCTYYQHISFQNPPMKKIITFWKHPVHQRIPLNKRAASNLLIETVHTAKIVSSKYSYDLVETRSWIYVIKK